MLDKKALYDWLHREPFAFEFFQAMRLLECTSSDKPRIGQSERPADDAIRLGQLPSLAFPPSTLATFDNETDPPRLEVLFLGLFGPNGPLPIHLTQYARDRMRASGEYGRVERTGEPLLSPDRTFSRFADIFHHRLLCLFYRSWANAQPTVSFDRYSATGDRSGESDRFATFVASLFGMGMPSCRDRDAMSDLAKLHYAGRLACQTRNPEGLREMIADNLGLPVEIDEFVGHWMEIPKNCRWKIGESIGKLGEGTTIGDSVWDGQHKFRVVIGPLTPDDYENLLPGGDDLPRLVALVRNYIGDELAWEVRLVLKKSAFVLPTDDVPSTDNLPWMQLNVAGRLGYSSWLVDEDVTEDASDCALEFLIDRVVPDGLSATTVR